ncbi:MAG: lipid II:glycine glycyltransferase FemX [Candidatus Binatia bacterium]
MKSHTSIDFSGKYESNVTVSLVEAESAKIVCLDPCADPRWQQLLERTPSSVFHSPAWLQVLSDTYGWDMRAYILLDPTGQPVAGMPFCAVTDLTGKRIVTLPFSDFCDPLVADSETWESFSNRLLQEQCPVMVRCLHSTVPLADTRFAVTKQARWHGLDLRPDCESQLRRLSNSCRWRIRRAQREGMTVQRAEQEEDVREFFALHRGIRKHKYRLLAQPYEFFTNIWRHFLARQTGVLLLARYQGKVIGSVVFLEWQDTLYYKFSASDPAYLSLGISELLIWEGIQYGKARGLTTLDFGLSDWGQDGLIQFKRKFATAEKTISFLRAAPRSEPTLEVQHARELLPVLTALFTDNSVPDEITDRAGEALYRFFA